MDMSKNPNQIKQLLEFCSDLFDKNESFALSDNVISAAIERFDGKVVSGNDLDVFWLSIDHFQIYDKCAAVRWSIVPNLCPSLVNWDTKRQN